jgi:hypothetical protein
MVAVSQSPLRVFSGAGSAISPFPHYGGLSGSPNGIFKKLLAMRGVLAGC